MIDCHDDDAKLDPNHAASFPAAMLLSSAVWRLGNVD